jgi:thiaminase
MKFLLSLIICSSVAGECMPPYEWPETFNSQYDCLMFGYEESIVKMKEIGRTDVNKYNMFIKFYCTPENTV